MLTTACQHKCHHVLSRRAVQAELLAALLLTVPSSAFSAETESTAPASRAEEKDDLDLTITEKVVSGVTVSEVTCSQFASL